MMILSATGKSSLLPTCRMGHGRDCVEAFLNAPNRLTIGKFVNPVHIGHKRPNGNGRHICARNLKSIQTITPLQLKADDCKLAHHVLRSIMMPRAWPSGDIYRTCSTFTDSSIYGRYQPVQLRSLPPVPPYRRRTPHATRSADGRLWHGWCVPGRPRPWSRRGLRGPEVGEASEGGRPWHGGCAPWPHKARTLSARSPRSHA